MTDQRNQVCPVELAGGLDSRLRRWIQDPQRLLEPYVREGMTVLDFGCGPGFFTIELARLVGPTGHVIAADLQPGMLEKARAKVRGSELEARIVFHPCQPARIGLSRSVDFVLAFYMVHELADPAAFFAEVRTLLSENGRILIVEPPLHVTKAAFESTLDLAQRAGLEVSARPAVTFSKAAVLKLAR